MNELELALRAALNILRDSVESERMPSGEPLTEEMRILHEQAIDTLAEQLRKELAAQA